MKEDKGLQELAEKHCHETLEEGRITRTVVRGEPRSFAFSPEFVKRLEHEIQTLRDSGITVDKILRGLEYQAYRLDKKYNELKDRYGTITTQGQQTGEPRNLASWEKKLVDARPKLKF